MTATVEPGGANDTKLGGPVADDGPVDAADEEHTGRQVRRRFRLGPGIGREVALKLAAEGALSW
jgi:hypothetical protein